MIDVKKISERLVHYVAKMAQEFGILHERNYRNLCIKLEFEKLREQGITVEKAEIQLSNKWTTDDYKLSAESIHRIIYTQ